MLDFTLDVISLIREYFVSDKRWLLLVSTPSLGLVWFLLGVCRCVGCEVRGLILGFVPG